MSLANIGFRFMVCSGKRKAVWTHIAEAAAKIAAGWTDCTDMTDREFDVFMGVAA